MSRLLATTLILGSALSTTTALAGSHDRSLNWDSTVAESTPVVDRSNWRYDLDLSSVRSAPSRAKSAGSLDYAPRTAFELSDEQRLDQRLQAGYRRFGENLAARIWQDPKGRRVKFDVEGRPGLGMVIPFR